jgi:hypothetical protein
MKYLTHAELQRQANALMMLWLSNDPETRATFPAKDEFEAADKIWQHLKAKETEAA